jgi:hypothetical protein
MEFLQFIFSSFWVWTGFIILLCVAGGLLIGLVDAIHTERTVKTYHFQDGTRTVEVWGASKEDVQSAEMWAAFHGEDAEVEVIDE